jgi:hypothetical protein
MEDHSPGDILHVESEIVEITPSRSSRIKASLQCAARCSIGIGSGLPVDGQAFGIEAPAVD